MHSLSCPFPVVLSFHPCLSIAAASVSKGMGLELALQFAQLGMTVVIAARNAIDNQQAVQFIETHLSSDCSDRVFAMTLDLASTESINQFVSQFRSRFCRLDLLVHNAGVLFPPVESRQKKNSLPPEMFINFLGPCVLTLRLLDVLRLSHARVLHVSSIIHTLGTLDTEQIASLLSPSAPSGIASSAGWSLVARFFSCCYSASFFDRWLYYSNSKLALLLFMRGLGRRYHDIRTLAADPGVVFTPLVGGLPFLQATPAFISIPILWLISFFMRNAYHGVQSALMAAIDPDFAPVSLASSSSISSVPAHDDTPLGVLSPYILSCRVQSSCASAKDPVLADKVYSLVTDYLSHFDSTVTIQQKRVL